MQNLPRRNSDRIRAICEQLPSKTDETLRDWFSRNLSLSDPMPREDVYTYLQLRFDQSEDIPKADIRLIARSILIYLFDEERDQDLLSFLRRPSEDNSKSVTAPLIDASVEISNAIESPGDVIDNGEGEDLIPGSHQLTELLAAIIADDQKAIDEALSPYPFTTRALVDALISIRYGDDDSAYKHLEMLDQDCLEAEYIKLALERVNTQVGAGTSSSGVQLFVPQHLQQSITASSFDIIGTYTNESELGAIFVRPLALRIYDKIFLLSREDRVSLFPDSGDVITHRSELRYPPKRRDLLHWRVSENENSTGKTRFRLIAELEPLLEVYPVSVPSHDPDEIRERIKALAATNELSTTHQTVFALADGIALLSPKAVDITRDEAFDLAWQSLGSLNTWLIEGRQYCLEPAKGSNFTIDLSTPESYLRRVFKSLEAEQKASLSKSQRRELFELFRASLSSENRPRAERIISSLEQTSLSDEDVETVLSLLNAKVEVRSRVQSMLDTEYASLKSEFAGIQGEIETLKQRRSSLKDENKEIERKNRDSIEATSSLVKQVFSKSIQEGLVTLANVEIFKALAGKNLAVDNGVEILSPTATYPIDTWITESSLPLSQALVRLMALGLNRRQAIVLVELCSLSLQCGALFILTGISARQCVQILARIDCEIVGVIDVPMGLTSGASFRDVMTALPEVNRIVALNADLSPVEIYAARIIDSYYEAAFDGKLPAKPFLLSFIGGEMSLPHPKILNQISIFVDLDQSWDSGTHTLAEVNVDSLPLIKYLREQILEKLIEVKPEYRSHVERALIRALSAVNLAAES
ncbi:hypothetical protein [Pseudomonas viridiflava]|uniref:hypothetical protein n=1 Tax=Pseudomonas viridiflava TaxID=33069 RepID=UPI002EBE2EE1|nr:hypothetical protein [Pseudomonas viridiflava]